MRLGQKCGDWVIVRGVLSGLVRDLGLLPIFGLLGQFVKGVLFIQRVGRLHHAPFVDRAGGADRDAIHAEIADVAFTTTLLSSCSIAPIGQVFSQV